jgi:hypothetical protein
VSSRHTAVLEHMLDAGTYKIAPSHFWGLMLGSASAEVADRLVDALKARP